MNDFYDLEKFIEETESIVIGSRALGVDTPDSDYDLCVIEDNLPEFLEDILHGSSNMFDIKKYFGMCPLHNAYLIPKITFSSGNELVKADVIIFTEKSDLQIIEKSIEDMKKIPQYLLTNKERRIHLFEKALEHYGFTR